MDKLQEIHSKYGDWPQAVDLVETGIDSSNLFDPELTNIALGLAENNPRKRAIIRIHTNLAREQHLMINAILGESYVQPHKHTEKEKTETFRILKGSAFVVFFDDEGQITNKIELNAEPDGRKIATVRPDKWHTFVPMSPETVILEAKRQPTGGYKADTDKTMAPWAPNPGDLVAEQTYLAKLKASIDNV